MDNGVNDYMIFKGVSNIFSIPLTFILMQFNGKPLCVCIYYIYICVLAYFNCNLLLFRGHQLWLYKNFFWEVCKKERKKEKYRKWDNIHLDP